MSALVVRIGAGVDERAQLAQIEIHTISHKWGVSRELLTGADRRYNGPYVIVEQPNGRKHEECGLASAETVIKGYQNAQQTQLEIGVATQK